MYWTRPWTIINSGWVQPKRNLMMLNFKSWRWKTAHWPQWTKFSNCAMWISSNLMLYLWMIRDTCFCIQYIFAESEISLFARRICSNIAPFYYHPVSIFSLHIDFKPCFQFSIFVNDWCPKQNIERFTISTQCNFAANGRFGESIVVER